MDGDILHHFLLQHTIHTVADPKAVFHGFNMYIGGTLPDCGINDLVHQLNDGGICDGIVIALLAGHSVLCRILQLLGELFRHTVCSRIAVVAFDGGCNILFRGNMNLNLIAGDEGNIIYRADIQGILHGHHQQVRVLGRESEGKEAMLSQHRFVRQL